MQPNDTYLQPRSRFLSAHSTVVVVVHAAHDALWDEIRCRQTGAAEKRVQLSGEAAARPMGAGGVRQRGGAGGELSELYGTETQPAYMLIV